MTEKTIKTETTASPLQICTASFGVYGSMGASPNFWAPDDVDKLEVLDIKRFNDITRQSRFFYRRDPIASTVLNKMVEIGITGLVFDKTDISENEHRIFLAIKDDLQAFIESCSLEFLISGLVVPEIIYESVNKEKLFSLGIKKYSSLTLPTAMWIRDPSTIKIRSTMVMDSPSFYVVLPEELIFFILNKGMYPDGNRDDKLYSELVRRYPQFVSQVEAGNKEILLDNPLIVRRKVLSDSPYPLSFLYPALEAMKHKRNLRRMDYSIASRAISAILQVSVGDKDFPLVQGNEKVLSDLREQMMWRNSGNRDVERIFELFTNHTVKLQWIFPDVEALLSEKKYSEINQDIFFALGFPRILTTGESERTGTSDPEFASISPVETMKNMQRKLMVIVEGILDQVARLNGIKSIPIVRFKPINLHSFKNFTEGMTALYETANISRRSFTEAFGYDWDDEVVDRVDEQKIIEEKGLVEFSPQAFSPQPKAGGQTEENTPNKDKKPAEDK